MKKLIVIAIISAAPIIAFKKSHAWQTGRVETETRRAFETGVSNTWGGVNINRAVVQTIVINARPYTFTINRILRYRWSKFANVTTNGPVNFAVEKQKVFIVDDSGQELDFVLVNKVIE